MRMISHTDDPRLMWYLLGWVAFCLGALAILVRDRARVCGELPRYGQFLVMSWKLVVFVPALLFVTFAGRFTDDETWDVVSGGGMSLLTFLTAPACIGWIYQVFVGRRPLRYLWVAAGVLLFSSSWFYDGYLLLRDGHYTTRWWSNLMLSPVLYGTAGLLWNLEAGGPRGVRLGFQRPDWPSRPADTRVFPIFFAAIPLVLMAVFILVAFVRWTFPGAGR